MESKELSPAGLKLENTSAKIRGKRLNILKNITKIVIDASSHNYILLPNDLIDTLFDSFEFKKTPEGLAWQLICRSVVKALMPLLYETRYKYENHDIETGELDKQLNEILESKDYFLPGDFFDQPGNLPLLDDLQPVLEAYLGYFDLEKDEIFNILIRFKTFFILALRKEWVNNNEYYKPLEGSIQSPFDSAIRREIEWEKYYINLEEQIATPVFSERFCLEQIYIPLRACYKQSKNNHENAGRTGRTELQEKEGNMNEVIVDIESYISEWIETGNQEDCVRIIHGGPGSGKSSFLKILAAKLARMKKRVLYIPLYEYNVNDVFITAVNQYFRNTGYFSYDLLNDEVEDKLIILFDGLDELSMQGKALEEIASSFVRDVVRNAPIRNKTKLRIQVIIAGRDVIVQRNENEFKHRGEVVRLLPYLIQEEEKNFIDDCQLFGIDQRDMWWTKYGELKNKPYNDGLPLELKKDEMNEVTAQPLLNYLIALALEFPDDKGKKIDFENLNTIYSRLLKGVYNREYASNKKDSTQPIASDLEFDDFIFALKEIALCTWHGNGRTTTVNKIVEYLKDQKLFDKFSLSAGKGAISLLTTFYFRQTGRLSKGEETFEFTHKSFSEYLVTLKIIDVLDNIQEELIRNETDKTHRRGWGIYKCLLEWLEVFGLQAPDEDLVKYITNELILKKSENEVILNQWQDTVVKLWEHVLEKGMPIEQLPSRPQTFKEENEQAIKAEKSLLIMHGLIARLNDRVSNIQLPQPASFGEFIGRLVGQKTGSHVFILRFCNHLNLNDAILCYRDLSCAYLERIDLSRADLSGADLREAYIREADLREADIRRADLRGAYISRSDLRRADLRRADLSGADLIGADLREADLRGTHLSGAYLREVDLRGADLIGADLRGADLREANLIGANLIGCKGFTKKKAEESPCIIDGNTKWT